MVSKKMLQCVVLFCCFYGYSDGLLDSMQGGTLEVKVQELTQKVEQLQQSVAALQNQNGPVAFTATLSKTLTNLGQHQQIVFDNVVTNVGNGYNPFHGHFTAPGKGVYIFFVTITNTAGHPSSVVLIKNGQWIGQVLADDSKTHDETSSTAVTIQLEQGDQVWVQNEISESITEILDGFNWSLFSGHLI